VHAWCIVIRSAARGVGAFSASVGYAPRTGYVGGGFNGSARSQMSEVLQLVLELKRPRKPVRPPEPSGSGSLVAEYRTRAVQAAIADAIDRGEVIDLRGALGGEGVGHRPHEFVGNCLMIAAGRSWASPLLSSWLGFSRMSFRASMQFRLILVDPMA
jgi:hypothetical protein